MNFTKTILAAAFTLSTGALAYAQNPIINSAYCADPSAHVFNGRVYVYPSHDIPAPYDYSRKDWFCMADYHVYSSDNLVDWVDHGVIVDQNYVPWVNRHSYSMWAPDCNVKDGKYYFYFPADNRIGLATADTPYGPFRCETEPIQGAGGIDPCIFIDDDGACYLIWSGQGMRIAKLKDNMKEFDGEAKTIQHDTPNRGLKEGPFMFKRNGIYYFTFPWVDENHECLCYCTGDSPWGPFKYQGKIMEQNPQCWTNHHSVIEFKGKWYLFYHHNDYSPNFDKNRSVCIDELTFNEDGSINLVTPTKRGVGVTKATSKIELDRYSKIADQNHAWIEFLRTESPFEGWKTVFRNNDSSRNPIWVEYDRVDFGEKPLDSVLVRVQSNVGGRVEIHADSLEGPVIAVVDIPGKGGGEWQEIKSPVTSQLKGTHDLVVNMRSGLLMYIDWIKFIEK